jgi:hypothetical protein
METDQACVPLILRISQKVCSRHVRLFQSLYQQVTKRTVMWRIYRWFLHLWTLRDRNLRLSARRRT